MHVFCFPGFIPGFHCHGLFGLLIFALIVGLIVRALFGDHSSSGYHGQPGRGGTGGFCAQCGAQFRDTTAFCPHCGARRS
ncbi:MAG: zinc ribbon domain-containing protein [Bryobacteraceae bacterium]